MKLKYVGMHERNNHASKFIKANSSSLELGLVYKVLRIEDIPCDDAPLYAEKGVVLKSFPNETINLKAFRKLSFWEKYFVHTW